MEYRVLARKYRPTNFDDLIGQEALVRTLSNAMRTGRVAHAFLLTGIRGIGKTTTARIIARALNCIGEDGKRELGGDHPISPCGVCSNCKMIAEDRHVDVLEMDAASHTGVGDIRELIETVRYLPTSARYKIYIIDEVHMLSNSAFNALLKTLEEPPPHVKFVFATTEARKIPVTILSRCQRFDLKRIDTATLAAHLGRICNAEQVMPEPEALQLISVAAEGSVRDSLSLLDQAIARGEDKDGKIHIATSSVRQMIGSADNTATFRLMELLLSGEIEKALGEVRQQYHDGADPLLMVQDALEITHLITRVKVSPAVMGDVSLSEHDRSTARSMADRLSMAVLARLWQMLLKGVSEVRMAPSPLAALEMLLVRIAYASQLPTPAEVIRSGPDSNAVATPQVQSQAQLQAAPTVALVADNTAAAPQPAATGITSFEQAVALFETNRELLLCNQLKTDVGLVAFEQGVLTLNAINELPRDFSGKIAECLTQWTGQPWKLVWSREPAQPSLHEQEKFQKQQAIAQASGHPLVAGVLEEFPGAKLVGVTSNS
jgi:DNA polymerase III subunit gamma/tau